jgi:hypothetical protein
MYLNVTPRVVDFDEEGYSVALRGTALLSGLVRGWFKTKIAWWPSDAIPGDDIVLDVPKATNQPVSGTEFDAALYWREGAPWKWQEPLWKGRFRVRITPEGPAIEEVP